MADEYKNVRSYEVSIWTLQDRFLSVLKWATMDCKGQIQEPEVVLRDDGTQEFSFAIPKFYYNGATRITNPMWLHLENQPLEANMHKLKVIFNKNTVDEEVLEFLVTSVTHDHTADNVDINVKSEGLAFHELGKLGYKISLSEANYTNALDDWELNGLISAQPINNIQFWNDLVFKDTKGNWKTNWTYELQMDWSAFSSLYEYGREEVNGIVTQIIPKRSDVLYEDEYVSSWELGEDGKMKSRYIQSTREKCRIIDVSGSNIYNITQTIAEQFGVFCRYEYEHDENYQIIGRKVIYYNNYIQDAQGHIDLTYPYSSASISRTVDNSNIVTKMFVTGVDYNSDTVTIMDVDANKTKEDYLLNFDYLHEIQGITDEQYAAIDDFEATMHTFNSNLIEIQERIRVLRNQLVEAEANATTYRNAVALDQERYEEAGRAKAELTGGTNYLKLDGKPCIVKQKEGYGYYITIGWEGVDPTTLKIYQTNNYTGSKIAYSDLITSYNPVFNEFNNLIRIDNITSASGKELSEGSTLWLDGYFSPTLAYDNIQKVWAQRKAIDEAEAKKAEEKVVNYNWYLNGIRVGYAKTDECRLGTANWPPAVATEIPSPIDIEDPKKSDRVGQCRAARSQADIEILNPFADLDNQSTSPDLLFYEKNYLEKKQEEISKFERMMGPALREGYWQPDNYHDYGDIFKDDFVISYNDSSISQPQTSHTSFIWDGDKYYEAETPLIYTANTAGDVEQHLTVDISDNLGEIAKHLNDLCFVYCNPSNIATIIELRSKKNTAEQAIQEFIKVTTPAQESTSSTENETTNEDNSSQNDQNSNETNDTTIASNFFDNITKLQTDFQSLDLNKYQYHGNEEYDYSNARYWREAPTEAVEDFTVTPLETIINTVMTTVNYVSPNITKDNLYTSNFIAAWESINQQLEFGITKIEELVAIISKDQSAVENGSISYNLFGEILDTLNTFLSSFTSLNASLTNETSTGFIDNLTAYSFAVSQTAALENTKYSSYRIGSGCELGWIYQKDGNGTRIPVLIITGAKTMDEDTFNFVVTNYYKTTGIDVDDVVLTENWTRANEAFSFIGYPKTDDADNILLNQWVTLKVLDNYNDFIGMRVENGYHAIRSIETYDYDQNGILRAPTPQEYHLIRQYPRLYFDTLKLKADQLKLFRGTKQLENYVDYYIIEDDRSTGLDVQGVGYYVTIKPEFIYDTGKISTAFQLIYSLSNIDVAIYLDALNVMYENSRPKVSYEVELSVLNPNFIHTAYKRLNQIVHINDNDLQLENVSGYISTVTMKLDKFWEDTVEVKNYETKFEDLFSTIVAQTEAMKSTRAGLNTAISAFTSTGLIDSNVIYNSINNANLNLSFGKGTLTIDQDEGIWGTSDSGVVAFRGGGIFTATEKDNSGNWIWNTGILPAGINANLITTGQLDTNKIRVYAGNELRFQWNGDGLYAYKSFTSDYPTIANSTQIPNNLIDLKQYVVFNSNGLFLTSEAGSYIPKKVNNALSDATYNYEELEKTVQRVEISWNGLILRNWDGDDVFYADPDTGNLTLKGNVEALSGSIGGWRIDKTSLSGYGINLVSGGTNAVGDDVAGIYLANSQELSETVTINNQTYYVYKYTDSNGQEKECYYDEYYPGQSSIELDNKPIYVKASVIVSVYPKYVHEVYTFESENSTNSNIEHPNEDTLANGEEIQVYGTPTTGTTTIYIVATSGSTLHIKDEDGNDIVYNMSTSPEASWYQAVVKAHEHDYMSYITEVKTMGYKEISNFSGTIRPVTNSEITFSVKANTGETTILMGQIGNFTINRNSLSGGTITNTNIDKDNYFDVGETRHTFGQCFCELVGSTETGEFTFTRVDGSTVNFNIAAMDAYKRAVAAAGNITLTLTNNNGTVTAVATSGAGVTVTKTVTVQASSGGGSSSGSTGCNSGCQNECTQGCAYSCTGGCKNTCRGSCSATCSGTITKLTSCFIAGTKVWLADYTQINIEELEAGMKVLAYNEYQQQLTIDIVIKPQTYINCINTVIDLYFSSGEIITTTAGHPFLSTDGWKALDPILCIKEQHNIVASKLQVGDRIITSYGTITLDKIILRPELSNVTLYNCRLQNYHTYLVGSGLVTHNSKDDSQT